MNADDIQFFQTLKNKLGERETEALVGFMHEKLTENNKQQYEVYSRTLSTKEEVFGVKHDVSVLKQDVSLLKQDVSVLKQDVSALKHDVSVLKQDVLRIKEVLFRLKENVLQIREEMAKLRGNLELKIAETKTDIIRWVFAFFVPLMLAIIGLYFKR